MGVWLSIAWKLALAVGLAVAILRAGCGSAPRRPAAGSDLRWLVGSTLGLYAVGALASVTHHAALAAVVYAAGIATCTLALWLSRGFGPGEDPPGGGGRPSEESPPPDGHGVPEFDWAAFERGLRAYRERDRRSRQPALR